MDHFAFPRKVDRLSCDARPPPSLFFLHPSRGEDTRSRITLESIVRIDNNFIIILRCPVVILLICKMIIMDIETIEIVNSYFALQFIDEKARLIKKDDKSNELN